MRIEADILQKAREVRRELHDIPERSGCEVKTKSKIKEFLAAHTHLQVEEYNGGIAAFYSNGSGADTIAFRADFDAVSLPDGSAVHLCGHDGHTAGLLGIALMLEKQKPQRNVLLIFQHAEETGEGAKAMAPVLERYGVSEVYGCHNLPGYSFGRVYTSLNSFACASCGLTFLIQGEPAHAAYPELGKSPMGVAADLFAAVGESQSNGKFPEGTFATLVGCTMGQKAFGTSAESAEVWITVRSRSQEEFRRINEYLEAVVKQACARDGLRYRLEIQDVFPATVNHPDCARRILERCDGLLLPEPMRWSEDFGHFLNAAKGGKGAFFGIGAGNCPNIHTKDYQYPEALLEHQILAFWNLL